MPRLMSLLATQPKGVIAMRGTHTARLVATSETRTPTALLTGSDPADLRPMVTGRKTPRTKGTADEAARATALIAALKAQDKA